MKIKITSFAAVLLSASFVAGVLLSPRRMSSLSNWNATFRHQAEQRKRTVAYIVLP